MQFKTLAIEDLNECVELFVDVFNKSPWDDQWTYEKAANYLSDIYITPGFRGIGLYRKQRCVAVILGNAKQWWSGKEFFTQEMFVDASHQGQGLDKGLIECLVNVLKEEKIAEISLLTDRGIDAEYFYKANKFKFLERLVYFLRNLSV